MSSWRADNTLFEIWDTVVIYYFQNNLIQPGSDSELTESCYPWANAVILVYNMVEMVIKFQINFNDVGKYTMD